MSSLRLSGGFLLSAATLLCQPYIIDTIYGGGPAVGSSGLGAAFTIPIGMSIDAAQNRYFISGQRAFRVNAAGIITLVIGSGTNNPQVLGQSHTAPAASLELATPRSIVADPTGNIYIGDSCSIWKIDAATGVGQRLSGENCGFLDGAVATARFAGIHGLSFDSAGALLVADAGNHRIRRISAGVVSTVVGTGLSAFNGDGLAPLATNLNSPVDVLADSGGNLYISEATGCRIRRVVGASTTVWAGSAVCSLSASGSASLASIGNPGRLALDPSGNLVFSTNQGVVRRILTATSTQDNVAGNGSNGFAGDGGPATAAQLSTSTFSGVAFDNSGNLWFSDTNNNRIRQVSGGNIGTAYGNGRGLFATSPLLLGAQFNPSAVAADATLAYISDGVNQRILKADANGVTVFAGSDGPFQPSGNDNVLPSEIAPSSNSLFADGTVYLQHGSGLRRIQGGLVSYIIGTGPVTCSVAGNGRIGTAGIFAGAAGQPAIPRD